MFIFFTLTRFDLMIKSDRLTKSGWLTSLTDKPSLTD